MYSLLDHDRINSEEADDTSDKDSFQLLLRPTKLKLSLTHSSILKQDTDCDYHLYAMDSFRHIPNPAKEPSSAVPTVLADAELTSPQPSQATPGSISSYNLPRSYSTLGTISTTSRENTRSSSKASRTTPSTLLQQLSSTSNTRTRDFSPSPTVKTPILLTLERSRDGPSEVDEILQKLGHPKNVVEILKKRRITTREDLLLVLRDEVRSIRLNLGLRAWEEDQETNRHTSEDEVITKCDTEHQRDSDGHDFKVDKMKLMKTLLCGDSGNVGCTPSSNSPKSEMKSVSENSLVASGSKQRRRPGTLNLREI